MIETLLIALPIAVLLHTVCRRRSDVRGVWVHATRLERVALLLMFAPIPGPVDELVGAFVVARVLRRTSALAGGGQR